MMQSRFWIVMGLVGMVTGCQGSEWGERFGAAVRVQPIDGEPTPIPLLLESPTVIEPTPAFPFNTLLPEGSTPTPPTQTPTPDLNSRLDPLPEPRLTSSPPQRLPGRFTDLDSVVLAAEAIAQLDQLGVFNHLPGPQFEPDRSVRRGEFARWLVLANHAIHADQPSRQIRLGSVDERPIFLDAAEDDPNFIYIQALGAAGLVQGDENQEFRPDSLLSRADLVRTKILLDLPPGSLTGDREELVEVWGFRDSDQIPDDAVAALVADRSLGDNSTILRTFGPIRALQPLEPVTRAELAIALSAFGDRTAADAIADLPSPAPTTSPSPDPIPTLEPSPPPSPPSTPGSTPTPTSTPTPGSTPTQTPSPAIDPDRPTISPDPSPFTASPRPNQGATHGEATGEFVTPSGS